MIRFRPSRDTRAPTEEEAASHLIRLANAIILSGKSERPLRPDGTEGAFYIGKTFTMFPACKCDEETCVICSGDLAGYTHLDTGTTARWYPTINNSLSIKGRGSWGAIIAESLNEIECPEPQWREADAEGARGGTLPIVPATWVACLWL